MYNVIIVKTFVTFSQITVIMTKIWEKAQALVVIKLQVLNMEV